MVTLDEWIAYYEEVSSSIDTDDYFGEMLVKCWSALKTKTADGRLVPAISYVSARDVNNVEKILRKSRRMSRAPPYSHCVNGLRRWPLWWRHCATASAA